MTGRLGKEKMKERNRRRTSGGCRWLAVVLGVVLCCFGGGRADAQAGDQAEKATETRPLSRAVISNVFYETDLREVLLNIADQAGVAIVAGNSVRGMVTMELSNLPVEDCLDRILTPLGYTWRRMDDYYLVGSATPDNSSFHLLSTTETITPDYLKAPDILKLMSDYYKPYVKAGAESNRLTITGPPEVIARFREDLAKIDTPPRQVKIEALVTEVSQSNLKEVGVEALIEGANDDRAGLLNILTGALSDSTITISGSRPNDSWGDWDINYRAAIKALIRDGMAEIRANPHLSTQEGRQAKIFIGKDQYYTIATGIEPYVYTRLEMIKVGISLEITPYVSDDDEITVEVTAVVSDVTGMGVTGLPVINTRDVSTRIQVADGESIVIGGLQTDDMREDIKKVPLLGDIPILGALFRHTTKESRKTHIVIIITPHLLAGEG